MKTIGLINIWFGKLPESFPLWIKSAQLNPTIDFYIVTDQDDKWHVDNVTFIKSSLDEIKEVFEKELNMRIKLKHPYKLCDFKPVWRFALGDRISMYDFWGVCDLDVVWGDIRKFITDKVLEDYDKIFDAGIFQMYRNCDEMNNLYKRSTERDSMSYSYRKAFRNNYACYFDEYMGMSILGWLYMNDRVLRDQKTEVILQDFDWKSLEFKSYINKKSFIFRWDNGKLYKYFVDSKGIIIDSEEPQEYALVHIQKRSMALTFKADNLEDIKSYWIYPNCYSLKKPTSELYTEEDKAQYAQKIAKSDHDKRIANLKRNGALDYISHYLTKKRVLNFIRTVKKFY